MIIVQAGISKPYLDNQGAIWVKCGADKRKVTSREEMQRIFQAASLVHGDEIPANGLTAADLDQEYFNDFFREFYSETVEEQGVSLPILLQNTNLSSSSQLNITGALLFAKRPQFRLPAFIVKAVCYPGDDVDKEQYLDSRDISGKLADVFQQAISFSLANLKHRQRNKNVNSERDSEIPRIVLEELIANALIHRDYFISAPVRIFMFSNRLEIISPGHLPNNLPFEHIKNGNSNIRNPILASFATKLLPYRGLGTGIRRALKAYPTIQFENDISGNMFTCRILREIK